MAYLGRIKNVEQSVRAVVAYLEKESRGEASIARMGINVPADPSLFMTAHRGLLAHHQVPDSRIEGRTTVISFAADELDPNKEEDCERGRRIIERTFQRAWGDRGFGVLVHMQRDGDTGLLHGHGLTPNVHQETGRAMRGDDYSWERIALILNEEMEREGVQHSHEAMRERVQAIKEGDPERRQRHPETHADRRARMRGAQAFPDVVAGAMRQAMSSRPKDLEELNEKLQEQGLSVRIRGKNTVFEELEPTEGRKSPRSSRHDRVERAYELAEEPAVPCSPGDLARAFEQSKQHEELIAAARERTKERKEREKRAKEAQRQRERQRAEAQRQERRAAGLRALRGYGTHERDGVEGGPELG